MGPKRLRSIIPLRYIDFLGVRFITPLLYEKNCSGLPLLIIRSFSKVNYEEEYNAYIRLLDETRFLGAHWTRRSATIMVVLFVAHRTRRQPWLSYSSLIGLGVNHGCLTRHSALGYAPI